MNLAVRSEKRVKKAPDFGKLVKKVIFSYSTEHLKQSDKVRFYYALKGRDGKSGIIARLNITQLGKTVLFVRSEHAQEVAEFLEYWKCKVERQEVFVEQ